MKKRFKIVVILILLIVSFIHFYLPRFITEIKNPLTKLSFEKVVLPEDIQTKYFSTFDGSRQCYNLRITNQPHTKGTIILLHGIRSRKEHYIELSEYLARAGYNSAAIDLRSHGSSEGTYCTFGVKEKQDITFLINNLNSLGIKDRIGVWGQSLGGAVALQATAYDNRIKYAIVESTFTDLETIAADYMELNLGFRSEIFSQYLIYRAGKIAGFKPELASPLVSCKAISVPTLMVHGSSDKRIKIEYGKANFKNLKARNKKFLEIENATHLNVWQVGGDQYFEQVFNFLETN